MDENLNKKATKNIMSYIIVFLVGCLIMYAVVYFFPITVTEELTKEVRDVTINDTGIAEAVQKVYDAVVVVSTYREGSYIASGTGFVYRQDGDTYYLLTNYHVIENSIKTVFEICLKNDDETPNDKEALTIDIPDNYWIHHPNPNVDLCCLPIASILNSLEQTALKLFYVPLTTNFIAQNNFFQNLSAMEEIVMIGYPSGISDTYNHKPIIRKGITATHLKNDYQGNKTFLIDMACFPGSSGSPIFILDEGIYKDNNGYPCVGNRLYLIGVLFQGPQYTAQGNLIFSAIPNIPVPITNIPMNLGEVIKAEEILAFEQFFSQEINKETNNG